MIFLNPQGEAEILCSVADSQCVVKYDLINREKVCVENCECLEDSWENELNQLCGSLGDCRGDVNYV